MRTAIGVRFEAMGLPASPGTELLLFWGSRQGGFDAFAHNPVDYAHSVRAPVLLLHGGGDRLAPPAEAQEIRAALPGEARLEVFPDVDHQLILQVRHQKWAQVVGDFLDQVPVHVPRVEKAL